MSSREHLISVGVMFFSKYSALSCSFKAWSSSRFSSFLFVFPYRKGGGV